MSEMRIEGIPHYRDLDVSGEAHAAAGRMEDRARAPASRAMFDDLVVPLLGPPPRAVLEVGCGTAALSRRIVRLLPGATVYADKSAGMLAAAREYAEADAEAERSAGGGKLVLGRWDVLDAGSFPFDAGARFGLILSSVMVPYLDDEQTGALVRDLASRLAPGGVLAFVEQDLQTDAVNFPRFDLLRRVHAKDDRNLKKTLALGLRPLLRDAGLELLPRRSFLWTDDPSEPYTCELLGRLADAALEAERITAAEREVGDRPGRARRRRRLLLRARLPPRGRAGSGLGSRSQPAVGRTTTFARRKPTISTSVPASIGAWAGSSSRALHSSPCTKTMPPPEAVIGRRTTPTSPIMPSVPVLTRQRLVRRTVSVIPTAAISASESGTTMKYGEKPNRSPERGGGLDERRARRLAGETLRLHPFSVGGIQDGLQARLHVLDDPDLQGLIRPYGGALQDGLPGPLLVAPVGRREPADECGRVVFGLDPEVSRYVRAERRHRGGRARAGLRRHGGHVARHEDEGPGARGPRPWGHVGDHRRPLGGADGLDHLLGVVQASAGGVELSTTALARNPRPRRSHAPGSAPSAR